MRTSLITLLTRLLRLWFRQKQPPLPAAPRSILILKPCCLGDVLLTTPLVAAIRSAYPGAHLIYAVGTWASPMVATSQHIDETLILPERWTPGSLLATARVLHRLRIDLIFVPDRSPMLTLLAWLSRSPVRVGLDSAGRGFAYTHRVPVSSLVIHEADLYSQLAAAAGLPKPPRRLFFFPGAEAEQAAAAIVARYRATDGPLVVLHPGGGQNPGMTLPRKRWLPERWATVADELIRVYSACVLVVGGPGDQEAVATVIAAMREPAIPLVRRWDWGELGALLGRSDLFMGHDTGMMHLATAVGAPVVAVFGPSDPQIYGPYGQRAAYVWRPTYESPCFYEGAAVPDCPCAMQCMRNVEVADVLQAARRLLMLEQKEA
ncbi:MAG TPA: glycosyltransferase family 9 protein [Herpetosiphonaceae bacterium]